MIGNGVLLGLMGREDLVKEMKVYGCQLLSTIVEVPRWDISVYGMVAIDIQGQGVVNVDPYGIIDILVKIPWALSKWIIQSKYP